MKILSTYAVCCLYLLTLLNYLFIEAISEDLQEQSDLGLHCRRGFKNILAYDKAGDMWVIVVSVQSTLICKIGFTN